MPPSRIIPSCFRHFKSKFLLVGMMLFLLLQYYFITIYDSGRGLRIHFFRLPNFEIHLPLCPAQPPRLEGRLRMKKEAPSMEELDKLYPGVEPGPGGFRPKHCRTSHKVAIIVPFRDRAEHLRIFLYNMHPILQRQQIDYGIYVIEQKENTTFNRAMLMNIGFVEASKQYDWECFIFHDVDLIPEDDRNLYTCSEQPRHMSVGVDKFKYKLLYPELFGGVCALTKEQFEKANGFSNMFWGWGGEDDDLYNRIVNAGYNITRESADVSRYRMLTHHPAEPNSNRFDNLREGKTRFATDGLNSLKYELLDLLIRRLYTWVYVELTDPS